MPEERYALPCPHPDCAGTVRVPLTLPDGDYPCLCHACTLHLRWTTRLHGARTPTLSLKEGDPQATP